jgi:MFS family permease
MSLQRNIKLLKWFNFCNDFRLYDAVAAVYFAQVTGSYTLGLSVFSISTISSSVFEVPTGIFSDLLGRKMTMVLGAISSTLSIIFFAIGGSFATLAVGALFGGLSQALFSGNNDALLYDTLKEAQREKDFASVQSQTSSMFQFALATSALFGSLVLGLESFKWVFWISVIPQALSIFLASQFIEPKRHSDKVETNIFGHLKDAFLAIKENYKLRLLSMAQIIDRGLGEAIHQFTPTFIATLWPVWAIGLARVMSHIFAATGVRISGRFIKKIGEIKLLILSNIPSYIVGLLAIIFPTSATPLINSATSFPSGLGWVALSSLQQKEFTDKQRATIASLNSLGASLLFGISIYALGFVADKIGTRYALLGAQILYATVLILYFRFASITRKTAPN